MPAAAATSAVLAPSPFTVTGFVRETDGTPIAGVVVSAYDENLRSSTLLGQVTTDSTGAFLVRYTASALTRPGKTNADLFVTAAISGSVIAQSPVMYHAANAVSVTLVRGNKPLVGPSELAAVQTALAPLLGTVQAAELTTSDIVYLSGASALNAGQVPHLAAAAQAAKTTGLDTSAFFAFARQGMATSVTPALAGDPAAQRQALLAAVAANLVPASVAADADKVVAGLSSAAITQTLAPDAYRLGGTLAIALTQAAQQTAFLTTLQSHKDSPAAFWSALATQPGFDAPTLATAQLTSQLAALTQYHAPLVTALLGQHTQGTIKGLSDLARLDQNEWATLLAGKTAAGAEIGVPPGVPGNTAAAQVQLYATALMRRMEVAFPTVALAARLAAGSKVPNAAAVASFLTANPDFDIAATDANRYLAGKSAPATVQQTLPAIQRLFRVAPQHDLIEPLMAAGYGSARSIARVPRARFAALHGTALGGSAQAEVIHRQALNVSGSAVALFGRYGSGLNRHIPRTIDAGPSSSPQVPNWDSLFGTPDFCSCTDCRSLLSPAAYLVDLLHEFLDVYLHDSLNNSGATLVLRRRPDIGTMMLDCNNTNTVLPYIDLVNELLENAVALTVPTNTAVPHDTTDGDSASLGAAPEYINPAAYTILAAAAFPWGLPFDLGLAQARAYLANLNVQRHALMHTFQANPAAPDTIDPSMTGADAVAADYLGLSPLGWKLLLGTSGATAWAAWGVAQSDWQNTWTAAGKGPTVQAFLNQSGATFQDLIDLLQTRFAAALATSATTPWQIQWNDGPTASCDPSTAVIQNMTEADFGLVLRFLRLTRALGTTVRELDALLGVPTATSLDAPLQVNLVSLDRLRRKLRLSFIEVATWWGNIPTLPDVFEGTSLYQRTFLNPAVINPVDAAFGLNANGTELAVTSNLIQDKNHQPTVLAGLQIVASDLTLLLATLPAPATPGNYALNLANLSALYRLVSFARALSLSISNFLSAASLFNVSFALSGTPASQRAPFDRTRAADAQWFADQITLLKNAGLKVSDVAYLLLDAVPPAGGPAPAATDMAQQLTTLAKTLQPILTAHPPPDPAWTALGTTAVETQLATWLNLPVPSLDALMGMTPSGFAESYLQVLLDPGFVTGTGTLAASDINTSLTAPVPATPATAPPLYYQVRALVRLKKIATIASRLLLQTPEIVWLVANAAPLGWLDFNALPAATPGAAVPALYPGFTKLATMCAVRTQLTPGQTFLGLMPPRPVGATTLTTYLAALVTATNWSPIDLGALTGATGFNFTFPDAYWDPATLSRLQACFNMLAALNANVADVTPWINADMTLAQANDVVSLVKSGYAVAQWPAIGKSLRDPLRQAQRDALVAWLIANSQAVFGQTFSVPDDLFGQLLIDPEMSSCMQTSRLIQATQSLQLYVDRALMGLEPGVTAADGASQAWVSMQQYQIWSANRQIFLYPENWLDPTLRDDTTDLFVSLQQELQKSAITSDSVETAYRHYLSGLNAVAHLRVCGMYHDIDQTDGIDSVYVFAHDNGTPPNYYWRQFVNASSWTQWEKVDLDIGGVDVVPVVYNRRPFVFWPIFKKISAAPPTAPVPPTGGGTAPQSPPLLWVRVQIAWSSYNEDKWAAKKVSDGPPLFVPVNTPERQQYIQENTGMLFGGPDYLLPPGDQPYVATQEVNADCIRADGSVDPSFFAFKAVPSAPTDTTDTLRVECFIQSWQSYIPPLQ